jgi:hypothetical protein
LKPVIGNFPGFLILLIRRWRPGCNFCFIFAKIRVMMAHKQFCLIALSVWAMTLVWPGSARAAADKPPASLYFTLDNGLQVLLQEKHDLPLTAMALAIDLGTKDETEQTSGYAHLLEHMLLFGAGAETDGETRLAELRGHGIAHNAHTDHDDL